MKNLKKYGFKISLILVLMLSVILCTYSIKNYNTSTNAGQNNLQQNNSFNNFKPMNGTQNRNSNGAPSGTPNGSENHNFSAMKGSSTSTNAMLSPSLVVYSVSFLCLFCAIYFVFKRKKIEISSKNVKLLIVTLLISGFLLRVFAATLTQGYSGDINLFKNWASAASNNFSKFYSTGQSSDYPPLYIYVLSLVGKIAAIGSMSKYYILLLKLPSIIADIASAYLIYKLGSKKLTKEKGILLSAFYIFNPAVFINSALWGQVDSFFTLIILLAMYFLSENKSCISAIFFAAGVLTKPQGIIFLPVLFFELVRQKKIINFIKAAGIALISAVVIALPFLINNGVPWIFKLYSGTVGEYPYASLNAYNFFNLIGANYTKYTSTLFLFSYHTWGMIFIVLITLFSWFIYAKGNDSIFAPAAALTLIAGVFTFSVGMHERYLFPAVALAILSFIYLKDKRFLLLAAGFSITSYINMHMVLFSSVSRASNSTSYNPVSMLTSMLNIILFGYLVKILVNITAKKEVEST